MDITTKLMIGFGLTLIGKIVFDWLKNGKAAKNGNSNDKRIAESIENIKSTVDWLKELHDREWTELNRKIDNSTDMQREIKDSLTEIKYKINGKK